MSKGLTLILTTPFRPNVGGVETHLDDLIEAGIKRGLKFLVLTYQPLVSDAQGKFHESSRDLEVIRIPWIRMNLFLLLERYPLLEFIYLFPALFITGVLLLSLKSSDIKTIHAQGLIAGAAGFFLGKLFGKKCLISTHSIYHFPNRGLYSYFVRTMLSNCDQVLTLSAQSHREIVNLGVNPKKVNVFTYWVDQQVFRPRRQAVARKKLELANKQFICLFVGRLVAVKGVRPLLKSAQLTKGVNYLVAGDGPLSAEVEEVCFRVRNIRYLGPVENKKLSHYYNAADVLIVPSTHEEGLGRVILEALSSGLPVVASNRGGIKEVVTPEVGLLIKVSPKLIAKTLEELRGDPQQLKGMAIKARAYARNHFSQKNAQLIFRYYAQ